MKQGSVWLLRAQQEESPRISYLELLLDLGLIVALTRLSQRLISDPGWFNALETVVLLAAIWWAWTVTVYTTDWYDPDQPLVQLIVLNVMFGGLLMSVAVVHAFEGTDGIAFAGAYVVLHLVRGLVLVTALRGHELRMRPLRVVVWFCLTGVLWLGGAFLPSPARLALWAVAVIVDYLIGLFGYPLPGIGRLGPKEQRVNGEHMSERYRQMFIVSLGEIVLVGVVNYGHATFGSAKTVALILLFFNTVALWRIYIVYVAEQLATGIEKAASPVRVGLLAAYAHLIMVAGVVLLAAGGEMLVAHPFERAALAGLATLIAGPVVFLLGRAMYAFAVFRAMLWRLPIGIVVIGALSPVLMRLPPLALAATMTVVLLTIGYVPHAGRPRYVSSRNIRTRW